MQANDSQVKVPFRPVSFNLPPSLSPPSTTNTGVLSFTVFHFFLIYSVGFFIKVTIVEVAVGGERGGVVC